MQIRWFGQAAFLLTSESGTRVLIDPYDRLLGYRMPKPIAADIVVVTHNHGDHNKTRVVAGEYVLANEAREYHHRDVTIRGVETYHDPVGGKKRGKNIVYRVTLDALTVAHCGDLGHRLSDDQAAAIGPIDVLLIPVGGRMTINGHDAAYVMGQLHSTLTIPMHYRTPALSLPGRLLFEPVETFVEAAGLAVTKAGSTLDVRRETLPKEPVTVVMQYQ